MMPNQNYIKSSIKISRVLQSGKQEKTENCHAEETPGYFLYPQIGKDWQGWPS